jgi:hypothetical protein
LSCFIFLFLLLSFFTFHNRGLCVVSPSVVPCYQINCYLIQHLTMVLTSCLWLNAKFFISWISENAKLVHLLSQSYHFIWMLLLASEAMLLAIFHFGPSIFYNTKLPVADVNRRHFFYQWMAHCQWRTVWEYDSKSK